MKQRTSLACRDRRVAATTQGDAAIASELEVEFVSEQHLWAFKREQQRRDIAALESGRLTENDTSWFSGGRARAFRLIDSPY
mgnify:CR=1 FL=1|jgi:hypothetical protein